MIYLIGLATAMMVACSTDENVDSSGKSTENIECNDGVCILTGNIVGELNLTSDNIYLLRGGVYIGDDLTESVINIEPGTVIYGESSTDGMLVIQRNSKIVANGTASEPIIFTSSKEIGTRTRGDWGGIIINGNAPINSCGDGGFCEAFGEGATGYYGGDNPEDDSGILSYVRVEFAGALISPDNELNGIALQGVGSETILDYIQVHMSADDGVEFFGGNANIKHLIVTGAGDDSLDWTDGWQGHGQYIILQQHADAGDNGIEADNNGENNMALPFSDPTLSNMTIVGANGPSSDIGILMREGTRANIVNTLVYGWGESSLDIDNETTWNHTTTGHLMISGTRVDSDNNFELDPDESHTVHDWFFSDDSNDEGGFILIDPQNEEEPNFLLEQSVNGAISIDNNFFDVIDYIGAVGDTDWTDGWTDYPKN